MTDINRILEQESALRPVLGASKKFPRAKIYAVGGIIRDLLLGRPSKDYDFVISGVKPEMLQRYLRRHGRVNLVGKTFGVFKFQPPQADGIEPIDIALPRTEHSLYLAGGYREFAVKPDYRMPIEEDLRRRDFTINALAWDVVRQKMIDPTGGLSDLASRQIRAVGQAEHRFREDYTRILRGLRLAIQLDFSFEQKTWCAIKLMVGHLNSAKVPREIVARELLKSFAADPVKALDLLDLAGVIRVLIPELLHLKNCLQGPRHHAEGDVWTHTRLALEMLFSPRFRNQFPRTKSDLELIIAILFHDLGKPYTARLLPGDRLSFYGHELVGARLAQDICDRLRFSSYNGAVDSERIHWLIHRHLVILHISPSRLSPAKVEECFLAPDRGEKLLQLILADRLASLSETGHSSMGNFYEVRALIDEIKKAGYEKDQQRPKYLLNGHEVMVTLGLKPGPRIGQILSRLRAAQLKKQVRTKQQAIAFLKRHYGHKSRRRISRGTT